MSNLQRACQQEKLNELAGRYARFPNDLGLFQGPGYTFPAPDPNCVNSKAAILQAGLAEGRVPASMNPSGQLYTKGTQGLTLAAPNSTNCDPGCHGLHADPRNRTVKPLYAPHVYDGPTPSVNTVTGMY